MKDVVGKAAMASADEARLVKMLKALGNPIRFQIMKTLAERQTCITQEIVATTPLAQSTVSQHLKVLREAGLIEGEISGPATCYCIDVQGVRWLKEQIERWLPECCASESPWISLPGQGGRRQPGRCC